MLHEIIFVWHRDPIKMLSLLLAVTWGFVNWRNLRLGGGIEYLAQLWDAPVFDEEGAFATWSKVAKWAPKAYDTNITISALHPQGGFPAGLARYLKRLRHGLAECQTPMLPGPMGDAS